MINKKTLSLKLNKSFQAPPDAPFTPVEQTLHTPVAAPNQNSYFAFPSSSGPHESAFFAHHDNDSDDVMTDVDEPQGPKVMRNYSVSFTAAFDQVLMNIYSHILSLPTTTPFSGLVPPSGLASRVAHETLQRIIADSDPASGAAPVAYDAQGTLSHDQLKNAATTPVMLQLIRKRLLDMCSAQKTASGKPKGAAPGVTSIQIAVPAPGGTVGPNSIYSGSGLRQSSISTLSLNEHNTTNYQSPAAQQSAVLAGSRSRSSSLNLRKHSLTRNNSLTGSSWLHVGNLVNVRSGGYVGSNPEFGASTDSLQSMNDFVPHAFLTRSGSSSSNVGYAAGYGPGSGAVSGFNSMMMDYQTPPSSAKSSFSQESSSPSVTSRENASLYIPGSAGSFSDNEANGSFSRARSLSRGANACPFPKPLTINTDFSQQNYSNPQNFGFGGNLSGETLHSPFISAVSAPEDFEYFGHGNISTGNVLENVSPNVSGLRNGSLASDCQAKDGNGSKVSIPSQYSLSEKKRDSLKMKRGIH